MIKIRKSLWDSQKQRDYWSEKLQASRKLEIKRQGEHTVADLDSIWKDLTYDQRSLMEFLVLSKRSTFVAKYEDDLFINLTSKGLLQIPPGVGTKFMQKMETAYSIPKAVWKVLLKDHERFFSKTSASIENRLATLKGSIGFRIEKLIR